MYAAVPVGMIYEESRFLGAGSTRPPRSRAGRSVQGDCRNEGPRAFDRRPGGFGVGRQPGPPPGGRENRNPLQPGRPAHPLQPLLQVPRGGPQKGRSRPPDVRDGDEEARRRRPRLRPRRQRQKHPDPARHRDGAADAAQGRSADAGTDRQAQGVDRPGGEVRGTLGLRQAGAEAVPGGQGQELAAQRHRPLGAGPAGAGGVGAGAGGRQGDAAAPGQPRPDRPAADAGGAGRLPQGRFAGRLREGRGSAAGVAGLRRTRGPLLARPGPLRRHQRLREGRPPHRLALPRLGHQRLQPEHAVRRIHRRADRRRPAAQRHDRTEDRHRLPPQHDGQHRGRHRRRGVPRRGRRGPRQHHHDGVDGHDDDVYAVSQP